MSSSELLEPRSLVSLTSQYRDFLPAFRSRLTDRRFWIVQAMVALVTAFHYSLEIYEAATNQELGKFYLITMYSVYLLPIIYASLNFGREGAVPTAIWMGVLAVPNIIFEHHGLDRAYESIEILTMIALAVVIATRVDREVLARQRAQAEGAARRVSELKYHSLFDNAGQAIIVFDKDGMIREANEAAASLFQADSQELRASHIRDALGSAALAAIEPSSNGERWLGGEFLLKRPGAEIWLEPLCTRLSAGEDGLVLALFRDVTSRRGFQSYAREIVRAQEDERQRIARDLHDISLQSIVLLCRRLDAVEEAGDGVVPVNVLDALGQARSLAEDIGDELRRFSRDLRPSVLDDLGLEPAIRSLLSELRQRSGIQTQFVTSGSHVRLPQDCEVTIFRISQECLRNAEKHSGANADRRQADP